jgi:hypothetical protein
MDLTTNITNYPNCSSNEKHFCGVFENNPSKIFSILFATVSTPIVVLLLYGIIWFEHFGSDHKRTLANKLLTSICWTLILGLFICSSDIVRYIFGPLPKAFCFVLVIAKNSVKTQTVLLYDAIIVTKYVFIFWLKNPAGVDDDFWCRFLTLWVVGFSHLLNFVVYSLPVR